MFQGQTYHGMSVPRRHTVPWRRLSQAAPTSQGKQTLLMGWWSQALAWDRSLGTPAHPKVRSFAQQAEARVSSGRVSLHSVRTHVGRFLTDYLSRRPLEEASWYHHPASFLGQQ